MKPSTQGQCPVTHCTDTIRQKDLLSHLGEHTLLPSPGVTWSFHRLGGGAQVPQVHTWLSLSTTWSCASCSWNCGLCSLLGEAGPQRQEAKWKGGRQLWGQPVRRRLLCSAGPHPAGSGTSGGREVTGPFASEADASACRVPRAAQTGVEVQAPDLCGLGLARGCDEWVRTPPSAPRFLLSGFSRLQVMRVFPPCSDYAEASQAALEPSRSLRIHGPWWGTTF